MLGQIGSLVVVVCCGSKGREYGVVKGGRVKYTVPDGSTKISELKAGEALLRPPVTHSDEALDDVDSILIELKN